jgi:Gram-negative bacterial TonB protein C-terminal
LIINSEKGGSFMSGQRLLWFLVLLGVTSLTSGCASFDTTDSRIIPPTLIEKVPLPPPPPGYASRDFYLRMELLVGKEGAVKHVTLTKATGDAEWDSTAVHQIMQWKYSPAMLNNSPIRMRIVQTARVVTSQPEMMDLSEIILATFTEADSAYSMLKRGVAFDSTAAIFRSSVPSMPSGRIGEVDIHRFPTEVQDELQNLNRGAFTQPLPLGTYYAIFERH